MVQLKALQVCLSSSVSEFNKYLFSLRTDLLTDKEDYVAGPHTITIPPGTTSGDEICTDLADIIRDDNILESTESFTISIEDVSPCGDIGPENYTIVNIVDNDGERW